MALKERVSQRWMLMGMLMTGVAISYCMRVNLSVAVQKIKDEYGWSESGKGVLLSSFFWGYCAGQIPGSYLAQRFGAKRTLVCSTLGTCLLTFLSPVIAHDLNLFCALRAALGLCQAGLFPSVYHILPKWTPKPERSGMVSFVNSGIFLGDVLGLSLSGIICSTNFKLNNSLQVGGWQWSFYVFALLGTVWCGMFVFLAYETPDMNPYMSAEEREYMNKEVVYDALSHDFPSVSRVGGNLCIQGVEECGETRHSREIREGQFTLARATAGMGVNTLHETCDTKEETEMDTVTTPLLHNYQSIKPRSDMSASTRLAGTPVISILTHPAAIALHVASYAIGWQGFFLISEMPSFLNDKLDYDIQSAALLCIAPYLANWISGVSAGQIADWLIHKAMPVRQVRQLLTRLGLGVPAALLVGAGYATSPVIGVTCLTIAQLHAGLVMGGVNPVFLEVSPNYSSTLFVVSNLIGASTGITSPIITSVAISHFGIATGWQIMFYVCAVNNIVACIVYQLFQVSHVVNSLNSPVGMCQCVQHNSFFLLSSIVPKQGLIQDPSLFQVTRACMYGRKDTRDT